MAMIEEDDDPFFASIDVDAIIAQSKQSTQSPPTVAKTRANEESGKSIDATSSGLIPRKFESSASSASKSQSTLSFQPTLDEAALKRTLSDVFGYDEFRHEQQQVIESALTGRDVSVFWATGCGKSMCYQLPAFHSHGTALVVSPLISLMNDQVIAINNKAPWTAGVPPATFLGSANEDPGAEAGALRGDFRLVYVTPEKLASSSFLAQLKPLADSGKLKLVAIDEAHCVSQWGPDFRPSYFELGAIRNTLPTVPIMALTATAVPRVRQDIAEVLQLRDPLWSMTSFDRPNLAISVTRKRGMAVDLEHLVEQLRGGTAGSTIVYVPTTAETETVANFLRQRLQGKVDVGFYHGKLGLNERSRTHKDFLSGVVEVVVATVAFGMGIDKPDIRRVVHYGAPKTFEEYYQQVGRAGRDGLPATCDMICSDNDFANYGSDFYVGSLTADARKAVEASTAALRRYANDRGSCRRLGILAHFNEVPAWEACGTCDVCQARRAGKQEATRDFRREAAVLLQAVAACGTRPPATTSLLQLVSDGAAPANCVVSGGARKRLQEMRKALPPICQRQEVLKDFLVELHSKQLLQKKRVKSGGNGYTWEVNEMTPAGAKQLADDAPLLLTLPPLLRAAEEAKEKKLREQMEELAKAGIKAETIPKAELDAGHGQVLSTHLMWSRTMQKHRDNGREEAVEQMEELLRRICAWRDRKARELGMAPANVLQEHTAKRIAYSRVTSVEALRAAGVRIVGEEELAAVVAAAVEEQVAKNGKKPVWEGSYERFRGGEPLQAIAMNQESGKPVLASTVLGHVLEALVQGRPVNLLRAAEEAQAALPSAGEWERLEGAALTAGVDVVQEERASAKEIMLTAIGKVDKEFAFKSEAEKEEEKEWYAKIKWWMTLKRAGVSPEFEGHGPAKRQRTE